MDNSLSKVNQISHLATKSVDEKKINLLQKQSNNDLGIVADQFESIFVYQMLKQARQNKLAEGIFSSEAQDTFNNMLDMEYSEILSKKNNFGIAEALIKQFQSHVHPKKDK
jgi:flagellar protein FlgJ